MKKYIFYAIPLFVGCLSACSDWDDHFDNANGSEGATTTLWQQIKGNPDLSDFSQVLEETKIFRKHQKTSVSYAQLLDGGQAFTVVAPVNGTFDKDSLLRLVETAKGDSIVEKSFVLNHLSRSLSSVGAEGKEMLLLNNKYVQFSGNTIEGVTMTTPNCRAKNGVLHIAERPLPYNRNLYQMLSDKNEINAIGALLRKYEEDEFDPDASVSSGIVEGAPVYVDSVIVERNLMLDYLGFLDREDSLYWVAAPTNEVWNRVWEETAQYFNYDAKVNKRDSLQQFWTTYSLMSDMVFNANLQQAPNDSVISVPYQRTTKLDKPVYNVFYKPFEEGGILYGARQVECSNGIIYEMDQWPYLPEKTFFRELWTETENTRFMMSYNNCVTNTRRLAVDSISDGGYLQIMPLQANSNWDVTFQIENTLSASYDIYAVVLPRTVSHPNGTFKPCKFKATINYVDENGVSKTFNCNNTQFKTDPAKVDTVLIAENFYLPACNYSQPDLKVSVKMQCAITAREQANYSREMYLDCIWFKPKKAAENEE